MRALTGVAGKSALSRASLSQSAGNQDQVRRSIRLLAATLATAVNRDGRGRPRAGDDKIVRVAIP